MLVGTQWGCLINALVFFALVFSMADHVDKAAMFVCGMLFFCTTIILRGLREISPKDRP